MLRNIKNVRKNINNVLIFHKLRIHPNSSLHSSDEPPRTDEGEEMLVYGPLPREPDEKLYPWKYERKDSGVRRFFRFFKELGANPSPRRGSSANNSPRPQRANAGS
ncbi:hypothetical protein ANCCAN_02661 [Ancylostoma caninum]|uniref:Uncharacterized protein n=2 Tax=Ancylostoma TaxID=29169 RepID=A0A368H7P4_ANCCA|nr:hypothetical protein ANCCAN_02661 [Ancylostoma caninum]